MLKLEYDSPKEAHDQRMMFLECMASGEGGAGRAFALPLFGGPCRK